MSDVTFKVNSKFVGMVVAGVKKDNIDTTFYDKQTADDWLEHFQTELSACPKENNTVREFFTKMVRMATVYPKARMYV